MTTELTTVCRENSALQAYADLLSVWGARVNLMAPKDLQDPARLWERHFLDAAHLIPFIQPYDAFIDVGSGCGIPGIVLAIMTGKKAYLIEPRLKRALFLQEVIDQLKLTAVVHQKRIESLPRFTEQTPPITCFISRAFKPLNTALQALAPQLGKHGVYFCLKGAAYAQEVAQARQGFDFDLEISEKLSHAGTRVLRLEKVKKL